MNARVIRPLHQEKFIRERPLVPVPDRVEYEAAVFANAVSFTVSRFLGVGRYDTRTAKTLRQACEIAVEMGIVRTMIYAVNAAGRSVLVLAAGKRVRP